MVTLITINKIAMVDDTNNKIEYIIINPLILQGQFAIMVKQDVKCCMLLVIESLDSSEVKNSVDTQNDMDEKDEWKGSKS